MLLFFFWIYFLLSFPLSSFASCIKPLNENELQEMMLQRDQEIETIKNHWKEKIHPEENPEFYAEVSSLISTGNLTAIKQGYGSTYLLCDEKQTPRFVIKPFDEDFFCLNNRKGFASPYLDLRFRVRENIPLYRAAQTEALTFEVASLLRFAHLTPKTHLMIITHENFHSILNKAKYEKLCSVQEFIPNFKNLGDLLENSSEEKFFENFDFEEIENLFIFIWCLYDTDAHAGNFYVTKDHQGKPHLWKIDNGLCFPTKNRQLLNILYFLPQAKEVLSRQGKERIKHLPVQKIINKMKYYELEDAILAFEKRIALLQSLAEKNLSLREIDLHLRFIEFPNVDEEAIHALSLIEIEKLIVDSKEQSLLDQIPDQILDKKLPQLQNTPEQTNK